MTMSALTPLDTGELLPYGCRVSGMGSDSEDSGGFLSLNQSKRHMRGVEKKGLLSGCGGDDDDTASVHSTSSKTSKASQKVIGLGVRLGGKLGGKLVKGASKVIHAAGKKAHHHKEEVVNDDADTESIHSKKSVSKKIKKVGGKFKAALTLGSSSKKHAGALQRGWDHTRPMANENLHRGWDHNRPNTMEALAASKNDDLDSVGEDSYGADEEFLFQNDNDNDDEHDDNGPIIPSEPQVSPDQHGLPDMAAMDEGNFVSMDDSCSTLSDPDERVIVQHVTPEQYHLMMQQQMGITPEQYQLLLQQHQQQKQQHMMQQQLVPHESNVPPNKQGLPDLSTMDDANVCSMDDSCSSLSDPDERVIVQQVTPEQYHQMMQQQMGVTPEQYQQMLQQQQLMMQQQQQFQTGENVEFNGEQKDVLDDSELDPQPTTLVSAVHQQRELKRSKSRRKASGGAEESSRPAMTRVKSAKKAVSRTKSHSLHAPPRHAAADDMEDSHKPQRKPLRRTKSVGVSKNGSSVLLKEKKPKKIQEDTGGEKGNKVGEAAPLSRTKISSSKATMEQSPSRQQKSKDGIAPKKSQRLDNQTFDYGDDVSGLSEDDGKRKTRKKQTEVKKTNALSPTESCGDLGGSNIESGDDDASETSEGGEGKSKLRNGKKGTKTKKPIRRRPVDGSTSEDVDNSGMEESARDEQELGGGAAKSKPRNGKKVMKGKKVASTGRLDSSNAYLKESANSRRLHSSRADLDRSSKSLSHTTKKNRPTKNLLGDDYEPDFEG